MQLKSVVASLLLRTWQPVINFAFAKLLPERPRRLTWCYVSRLWLLLAASLLLTPHVAAQEMPTCPETYPKEFPCVQGLFQQRVQKGFEGHTGLNHVMAYLNSPEDLQLIVSTRAKAAGWELEHERIGHEPDGDRIRASYNKGSRTVSTSVIAGKRATTLLVVELFNDPDT